MAQDVDRPRSQRGVVDGFAGVGVQPGPTATGHVTSPVGHRGPTPQPLPFVPHPRNSHPAAPEPSDGTATAGLAVAVVAAVLAIIPVIGTVAWVVAPIALVLSVIGLVRARHSRAGRRASVVGVVLGVLALVVCVIYAVSAAGAVAAAQQQATAVHHVTYKVTTAKGSRIAATYSQSRDGTLTSTTVTGAGSPWSANAEVSGFMGATVSASLHPDAGRTAWPDTITCTITEDGVEVAHEYANGPGDSVTCTK